MIHPRIESISVHLIFRHLIHAKQKFLFPDKENHWICSLQIRNVTWLASLPSQYLYPWSNLRFPYHQNRNSAIIPLAVPIQSRQTPFASLCSVIDNWQMNFSWHERPLGRILLAEASIWPFFDLVICWTVESNDQYKWSNQIYVQCPQKLSLFLQGQDVPSL